MKNILTKNSMLCVDLWNIQTRHTFFFLFLSQISFKVTKLWKSPITKTWKVRVYFSFSYCFSQSSKVSRIQYKLQHWTFWCHWFQLLKTREDINTYWLLLSAYPEIFIPVRCGFTSRQTEPVRNCTPTRPTFVLFCNRNEDSDVDLSKNSSLCLYNTYVGLK